MRLTAAGSGRVIRLARFGFLTTFAAVLATILGSTRTGVLLTAAVLLTLLAILGNARMAVGPLLAVNALAVRVILRTSTLLTGIGILAPLPLTRLLAARPAATGRANSS